MVAHDFSMTCSLIFRYVSKLLSKFIALCTSMAQADGVEQNDAVWQAMFADPPVCR